MLSFVRHSLDLHLPNAFVNARRSLLFASQRLEDNINCQPLTASLNLKHMQQQLELELELEQQQHRSQKTKKEWKN